MISLITDFKQRLHNANQMAMSMLWQVTSTDTNSCFFQNSTQRTVYWDVDWDLFMDGYLNHAYTVKRNEDEGLTIIYSDKYKYNSDKDHINSINFINSINSPKLNIAIASVCDYEKGNTLYQIDEIVFPNKKLYADLHGYTLYAIGTKEVIMLDLFLEKLFPNSELNIPYTKRHPAWYAVMLPLAIVHGFTMSSMFICLYVYTFSWFVPCILHYLQFLCIFFLVHFQTCNQITKRIRILSILIGYYQWIVIVCLSICL